MPDFSLEDALGGQNIAGVDEVGYGAWAGPVLVAAVILYPHCIPERVLNMVEDSKKLSPAKRNYVYEKLLENPAHLTWVTRQASVEEIAQYNVLGATLRAMACAVEALRPVPKGILVDGRHTPPTSLPTYPTVRGDGKSLSIAAASILAKVTRDTWMVQLHQEFPEFCWQSNKGYGTASHASALKKFGLTPHHRIGYRLPL